MALLGLLITGVLGAALLRTILGTRGAGPGGGLLIATLGTGLGVAMLSALRFWCLLASCSSHVCQYLESGFLLLAVIAAMVVCWRGRNHSIPDSRPAVAGYQVGRVILALLVLIQLSMTLQWFQQAAQAIPYGMWDAWAFWNVRARVLMLSGDDWRRAFDGTILHPDYPLLLPLTVLRGWEWTGEMQDSVAFAISALFFGLTAFLLFALLHALRGTTAGLMAVAVFLATGVALEWGPSQYADIPLAFYYLASLGCMTLAIQRPEQSGRWLAVLGLSLSAAAWTKNEGLAWAAIGVISTSIFIMNRRLPRSGMIWFLGGLAPLAITLCVFKLAIAGQNDLVTEQSGSTAMEKLFDMDRHRLICQYLFNVLPTWIIWLTVCGLLLGVRRSVGTRMMALWSLTQLLAIILVYYMVYLLTPHDLNWHLRTSHDRLLVQIWPGFLFTLFNILRTPEEILTDTGKNATKETTSEKTQVAHAGSAG